MYTTSYHINTIISFHPASVLSPHSVSPSSSPRSPRSASLARQSCRLSTSSQLSQQLPILSNNQLISPNSDDCANILGLSDFEYSFSLPTKSSKSCCFPALFAKLRFCKSGLYFRKSCSSVGDTQMMRAGPPMQQMAPLGGVSIMFPRMRRRAHAAAILPYNRQFVGLGGILLLWWR